MSDALSQTYPQGYFVQLTISPEFLTSIYIYSYRGLTLSAGPGTVIEIDRLGILAKERIVSQRYTKLSAEEKREVQLQIAELKGGYAVVTSWLELKEYLQQLVRQHGYSHQNARSLVLSWLSRIEPESN